MRNKLPRQLSLVVLVIIALAAGWVLSGQPARDKIIDSALITVESKHVILDVRLTFPFRYLSHFPPETGSELRIRIVPVRVPSSDLDAVFKNEGLVPPDADIAAIDQVLGFKAHRMQRGNEREQCEYRFTPDHLLPCPRSEPVQAPGPEGRTP